MISTVESMASPRNKYNTLTAGEAKKLSKFLSHRQPTRTASVLHKPRPPPMVVTDLDTVAPKPAPLATTATFTTLANTSGLQTKSQLQKQNGATATVRSSSSCSNHSYRGHRHSMNFGPNYVANNRYATLNAFTKYNYGMSDQNNKSSTLKSSPNDSESNLSFRSSLDIVDSAYGSDRIQTLSVDLGKPAQHYNNNNYRLTNNNQFVTKFPQKPAACYDNHNHQQQHEQQSNKISDESFSSAKSHQSESAKQKSLSKTSLSTSTSRVFQNQLCSLKKFFRYMPIRRSYVSNNSDNQKQHSTTTQSDNYPPSIQSSSLEESLSQLFLNRSQSPPICPPPPGELKSMSYMENSVNYSNYDEFTRARNKQASLLLGRSNNQQQSSQKDRDDFNPDYSPNGFVASEYDEGNSWQLTSLPISYERNLTTVFEEKLNSLDTTIRGFRDKDNNNATIYNNNNNNTKKEKHLIKPPDNFEDKVQIPSNHPISNGSSSQSLASVTTADSILDFHRQTATSFRFSYARPSSFDRVSFDSDIYFISEFAKVHFQDCFKARFSFKDITPPNLCNQSLTICILSHSIHPGSSKSRITAKSATI